MELVTRPDDLRAAAAALSGSAARLEAAAVRFARQANHRVFDLGMKSGIAAAAAVSETERAVATLHTDIAALARALDALSQAYPRVDRLAVPAVGNRAVPATENRAVPAVGNRAVPGR